MFKNYLMTALRNIYLNKISSFINIGGLAIGIAACLLISMFVRDEFSYDKWIKDVDSIYLVETTFILPGQKPIEVALTQMPVAPALLANYPQIQNAVRVVDDTVSIKRGDTTFEESVYFVDKDFFSVFELPLLRGQREQALNGNTNILLSASTARKYFGDDDPIGKILTVNGETDYLVAGVLKDTPINSHFKADFVALLDTGSPRFKGFLEAWDRIRAHTYIKLKPGTNATEIESDMGNFIKKNNALRQFDEGSDLKFNFINATKIHLYGTKPGHLSRNGDIVTVISFAIIALFILIIASINFMNLSTARSMSRAREVSIRKVHGATRSQLVIQFLGESMIMTFMALILALFICAIVLPWYNEFLNKQLSINFFVDPVQFFMIVALSLLIGFLGGIYPAFVLSSFRPARVLRSNKSSQQGSAWFRSLLVILQFSISIALSLITAMVFVQTNYARNIDFGFETQNKLSIHEVAADQAMTLKAELSKVPGVEGVAFTKKSLPFAPGGSFEGVEISGSDERNSFNTEIVDVGSTFFGLYKIKPRAGRVFTDEFRGDMFIAPTDTQAGKASIVVNRTFLVAAGIAEAKDIIDRPLYFRSWRVEGKVVGVIDDIYTRSLHQPIEPMAFVLKGDSELPEMTINIGSQNKQQVLAEIDQKWHYIFPNTPIARDYVADRFDALYYEDDHRTKLFSVFAFFAILISCLGLYGLASYTIARYSKEIGIRKVLGASVIQIVRLLVWQFTKPVLVASLISIPVATWLILDWLTSFEYRINLLHYWYIYLIVTLAAFMISWGTVAGQSTKVARSKLVDALQSI